MRGVRADFATARFAAPPASSGAASSATRPDSSLSIPTAPGTPPTTPPASPLPSLPGAASNFSSCRACKSPRRARSAGAPAGAGAGGGRGGPDLPSLQSLGDPLQIGQYRLTLAAFAEVPRDFGLAAGGQLPVEVSLQFFRFDSMLGHCLALVVPPGSSKSRSAILARKSRERTVPMGTFSTSAISW